jgi:hypothetical protein
MIFWMNETEAVWRLLCHCTLLLVVPVLYMQLHGGWCQIIQICHNITALSFFWVVFADIVDFFYKRNYKQNVFSSCSSTKHWYSCFLFSFFLSLLFIFLLFCTNMFFMQFFFFFWGDIFRLQTRRVPLTIVFRYKEIWGVDCVKKGWRNVLFLS